MSQPKNNNLMIPQPIDEENSDDDVAHFQFWGGGRLILDTIHGQVIIDVRTNDVNAFTFRAGERRDFRLLGEP